MSQDKKLSLLVDSQLPNFISDEYENFARFIEKYYQYLESTGQSLDIINNITKYYDIDFYDDKNTVSSTKLSSGITGSSTTINVTSTVGFPKKDGYIQVGTEVVFYKEKTATSFTGCYRNVRGTTKLGDLYRINDFETVASGTVGVGTSHSVGEIVNNLSTLFLDAFIKNFEKQYLAGFPEKNLKEAASKNLLIRNINKFYQSKGSEYSFQFLFNTAVETQDVEDIPTIQYPRDNTIKLSGGEWSNRYVLQVSVVSGDATNLVGQKIEEISDGNYASAIVDTVYYAGVKNGVDIYELTLSDSTIVGNFSLSSKTTLTSSLSSSYGEGEKINVFSTFGFSGEEILIGNEKIVISDKNVNQFTILQRTSNITHLSGETVFSKPVLTGYYEDTSGNIQQVSMVSLGYLYNVDTTDSVPYLKVGDRLNVDNAGSRIPFSLPYLTFVNENQTHPSVSGNSSLLDDVNANVSAIYEDSQYYYVASSGFPSHTIGPFSLSSPQDQKLLRLIRKSPSVTADIYETSNTEVGIFANGVRAYSYKDTEKIVYGNVESITVINPGTSYQDPPYVLIDGNATARAIMSGQYLDSIEITDGGSDYEEDPVVTITSGRNAVITATITADRVTRLNIVDSGEYYSSPPTIVIKDSAGRGKYAEYTANISVDGKIIGFNKINEGRFYNQNTVSVEVIPVGREAEAVASVKRWTKNRYVKLSSLIDSNYGYYFDNIDSALGYGYGYLANPKQLRVSLQDNLNANFTVPGTLVHSKILGYAYDGNPIYGPYGYSTPLNPSSSIVRMTSSYSLNTSRPGGPTQPLGTFIEDYQYVHKSGTLDENNGRYCITPEYPNGVYAYFITIDSSNNPVFPYILGKNFYNLPVLLNFESKLNQNDLPKNVTRLRTPNTPTNGSDFSVLVNSVNSGEIDNATAVSSPNNFSIDSKIYLNDYLDDDSALLKVSSVKGKTVSSIKSQQTKIIKLRTNSDVYFYDGDTITQATSGATGVVIGDVFDARDFVIQTSTGTFTDTNTISSNRTVENLVLSQQSSFLRDSEIYLTNGNQVVIESISSNTLNVSRNPFSDGDPIVFSTTYSNISVSNIYYVKNATLTSFQISSTLNGTTITLTNSSSPGLVALSEKARGKVLQSTNRQNIVKIELIRGSFTVDSNYYIASPTLSNTVGSQLTDKTSLSKTIGIFSLDRNVAMVTTSENHQLSLNDEVSIDISPNDSTTTTTYYVRKRIHQKALLIPPVYTGKLVDTGVGNGRILNRGSNYSNNTYTNVELIFADPNLSRDAYGKIVGNTPNSVIGSVGDINNAKATIVVSSNKVSTITITTKGKGYKRGDILTVVRSSLNGTSTTNYPFLFEVIHVGFADGETKLFLDTVDNLSNDDYLQINDEIVKITSVNSNYINVLRAQNGTVSTNHSDGAVLTFVNPQYRLNANYTLGSGSGAPIVLSYDSDSSILNVVYQTTQSLSTINPVNRTVYFLDQSTPAKVVSVSQEYDAEYNFEFSKGSTSGPWLKNPIIEVQRFYKYKFDTSSTTLSGSYFEFSPSINKNIVTIEQTSNLAPGTAGAYVDIKFGYGDRRTSNTYTSKVSSSYVNYFYYDKNDIIKSNNSYITIVDDPLQGVQNIIYLTSNKFVYSVSNLPPYDGSGTISYTTTSKNACGTINSVSISNFKNKYNILPEVIASEVCSINRALVEVEWNQNLESITKVNIINSGLNYVSPILIVKGDGKDFSYEIVKNSDGSISSINVTNSGTGFTYRPEISVCESSIDIKLESSSIGTAKSLKIINNGYGSYNDTSLRPIIKSPYILVLKNYIKNAILDGEDIEQYENNVLIASGVAFTNYGNNIIRVTNATGLFKENLPIIGKSKKSSFTVTKVFVSDFNVDVRPYYDNQGRYISDKSSLNSESQKITDSYYYQDYSYIVKSRTSIENWRDLVKSTTHPAGFNLFSQMDVESEGSTAMSSTPEPREIISIIQLWDNTKNRVTVESTKITSTHTIVRLSDLDTVAGKGSVIASSFDSSEITSFDIKLTPDFNGYFGPNGNRVGTTTFSMLLSGSNTPYALPKSENLVVSLDGIVQEPGVSYTITDTQITFNQPPLGYRDLEGNSVSISSYREGIDTPPQKFIGKTIRFKDPGINNQLFRKIRSISSQIDGITDTFDLYYTDNTPVDLISNENLLVSIDGIIQLAGFTPLVPIDRAYYIRRSVVPNQIVFREPPKVDSGIKQKFFAYSIGSYERIGIDEQNIDGSSGPFRIFSSITGRSITLDEERNVLVFSDGVLQKRIKNYSLSSSSITFTEPLKKNQKINIIHYYGKDLEKSLLAFNFDYDAFLNSYEIVFNGQTSIGAFDLLTTASGAKALVKSVKYNQLVNRTYIDIVSQNVLLSTSENITVTNQLTGVVYTINSSNIVSIQNILEDDGISILERTHSYQQRFAGSIKFQPSVDSFIKKDDFIRVHGEDDFRTVLAIPKTAKRTQCRSIDDLASSYFGKIKVTNYNKDGRGEKLEVIPTIENGSVVSLSWNKPAWPISSTPGFGYETPPILHFVSQPVRNDSGEVVSSAVGGGASAKVILSASGDVVDVVLTSGGSGYVTPPKVYVAKQYDLKKTNRRAHVNNFIRTYETELAAYASDTSYLELTFPGVVDESIRIVSFANAGAIDSTQEYIRIFQLPYLSGIVTLEKEIVKSFSTEASVTIPENAIYVCDRIRVIEPIITLDLIEETIFKQEFIVGVIDTTLLKITNKYSGNVLGQTFRAFYDITEMDNGYAAVSGLSIYDMNFTYPTLTISQVDDAFNNKQYDTLKVPNSNIPFNYTYSSIQEHMTKLTIASSTTDTVIYVTSTARFPNSGVILLEDELIYYGNKFSDRFYNVTRGYNGTTAKTHSIGAYLRTIVQS